MLEKKLKYQKKKTNNLLNKRQDIEKKNYLQIKI
jgi:hypothetical protein